MKETIEQAAMQELTHSYATIIDGEIAYQRQAMLSMFRKGAQWQSKQSPWISIEERLPEKDDDLYIALDTKMNPHGCDVCEFNPQAKTWTDSHHIIVHPTHWMPIPE